MTSPHTTSSPTTCKFCGSPLRRDVVVVGGATISRVVPCGCDGAVAARARADEEEERARRERESRLVSERLAAGGVPARYSDVEADHSHDEALLAGRGLYVSGPVGTGKTRLACAVARAWSESGRRPVFRSTVSLMTELRPGGDPEGEVVARMASASLLVLDDLGKDAPTDWVLSKLFQVVNDRYNALLPVVVTTQLTSRELAARLASRGDVETAEAIVSRLCETCDGVRLGGPDRRLMDRVTKPALRVGGSGCWQDAADAEALTLAQAERHWNALFADGEEDVNDDSPLVDVDTGEVIDDQHEQGEAHE